MAARPCSHAARLLHLDFHDHPVPLTGRIGPSECAQWPAPRGAVLALQHLMHAMGQVARFAPFGLKHVAYHNPCECLLAFDAASPRRDGEPPKCSSGGGGRQARRAPTTGARDGNPARGPSARGRFRALGAIALGGGAIAGHALGPPPMIPCAAASPARHEAPGNGAGRLRSWAPPRGAIIASLRALPRAAPDPAPEAQPNAPRRAARQAAGYRREDQYALATRNWAADPVGPRAPQRRPAGGRQGGDAGRAGRRGLSCARRPLPDHGRISGGARPLCARRRRLFERGRPARCCRRPPRTKSRRCWPASPCRRRSTPRSRQRSPRAACRRMRHWPSAPPRPRRMSPTRATPASTRPCWARAEPRTCATLSAPAGARSSARRRLRPAPRAARSRRKRPWAC